MSEARVFAQFNASPRGSGREVLLRWERRSVARGTETGPLSVVPAAADAADSTTTEPSLEPTSGTTVESAVGATSDSPTVAPVEAEEPTLPAEPVEPSVPGSSSSEPTPADPTASTSTGGPGVPRVRPRAAHAAPTEYREPGHESAWTRQPLWSERQGLESVSFARTPWGHRGYEEPAVDAFVSQVVQDLRAADEQIGDLRAEVDRLHRYIRRQWTAVATAESAERPQGEPDEGAMVTPAAQAQAVLTQAQEIAERRLAEADDRLAAAEQAEREAAELLESTGRQVEAKLADADREATRLIAESDGAAARQLNRVDAIAERVLVEARQDADERRTQAQGLLVLARSRYEDIVVRAHRRADRAAEMALDEFQGPGTTDDAGRARVELEMKAAYLRTFAKVSRAALQAALDVTAREFDRLVGATAAAEKATGSEPAENALPDSVFQESGAVGHGRVPGARSDDLAAAADRVGPDPGADRSADRADRHRSRCGPGCRPVRH
jgi:cell division septum initiation protein DivIVA